MALPVLGIALLAGGLLGSGKQKQPKYNMGAMNQSLALIEKQAKDLETFFSEAGGALDEQFGAYQTRTMEDATSALASSGIYESPVSERSLGRTRQALGESYAGAKSQLAGQKMSAMGDIDRQKINYYQNLASMQYQMALEKMKSKSSLFSTAGGIGGAIIGGAIAKG